MSVILEDKVAPGESIRITMDGANERGERISRVIAEWHGIPNDEANVFGMSVAGAMFEVVDGFRNSKAVQSSNRPVAPAPKEPEESRNVPGQMR